MEMYNLVKAGTQNVDVELYSGKLDETKDVFIGIYFIDSHIDKPVTGAVRGALVKFEYCKDGLELTDIQVLHDDRSADESEFLFTEETDAGTVMLSVCMGRHKYSYSVEIR